MLAGGCYCGAVRYEVEGPLYNSTLCHCVNCRRIAGAPAVAWFSAASARLRITQGELAWFRSSPGARRGFCGRCGSHLVFASDAAPGEVDITTCSLDAPELVPPRDHTFASRRLPWLQLADGLPVHARTRAGDQNE